MKHQFSCQCHQFGDTSGELKEVPDEEAVVVEEVLVATDEEDRVIVESDRDEEDTEENFSTCVSLVGRRNGRNFLEISQIFQYTDKHSF